MEAFQCYEVIGAEQQTETTSLNLLPWYARPVYVDKANARLIFPFAPFCTQNARACVALSWTWPATVCSAKPFSANRSLQAPGAAYSP